MGRFINQTHTGLVVDDLARRFGKRWAVARVSFSVPPATVMMLTGANGSGKTTLLRCLATALRPHHGEVRFNGVDTWTERSTARTDIGFLSHQSRLYTDLSAYDNLTVWARLGGRTANIPALLERVGLVVGRRDPVRTFSAGMKRRLSLARTLLGAPKLLLLDEPFSAFDPEGQDLVRSVVVDARNNGAIVVITTHVPHLAAEVCDIATHLNDGRVQWEGTVAERLEWQPS